MSTFKPLLTPISVNGVGGGVQLTHYGRLIHLPYPFDLAYYSADLKYNLFSLGAIQRLGGFYTVDPDNQLQLLIKSSKDGSILATAALSDDDLLPFDLPGKSISFPADLPGVSSSLPFSSSSFPSLLLSPSSLPSSLSPSSFPSSLFQYDDEQLSVAGYTKRDDGSIIITPVFSALPPPVPSSSSLSPPSSRVYSSEQRVRARLALDVHSYNHASNISNGTSCECGIIPLCLTGKDFEAADHIFGACGACVSKHNSTVTHGSTSDSPPPTHPGQLLHADLLKLKDGSIVLFTQDDHCGYLKAVKLFVGKTKAGVQSGWDTIRNHYNERGFPLHHVNTDSEEIFKESSEVLQERGILCSLSPPGTHEKSLERSWQTTQKRMHVVEQSLGYVLPLGLQYSLLEHVSDILNSYCNSKFPSSSPHIVMNGTHNGYDKFPGHLPICFGTFVQSRESAIVPQTGIVVGVTSNSAGSQKVYFPSYDNQKGASILHRKASELTKILNCPREWNLVAQVIPVRGAATSSFQPSLVPLEPISQPVLNPIVVLSPLLPSQPLPLSSSLSFPLPLVPIPLPSLPLTALANPALPPSIFIPPPPLSSIHTFPSPSTPSQTPQLPTITINTSSLPLPPLPPPSITPVIISPHIISPPLSSSALLTLPISLPLPLVPLPSGIPSLSSSSIPVPLRRSTRSTKGDTPP
jgi:hypothetical protein